MRILYVLHEFFPEVSAGTERITLNMAHAMQRAGHYVEVICHSFGQGGSFSRGNGILWRRYSYEGVPVTAFSYPYQKFPNPMDIILSHPSLSFFAKEVMRKGRYNLVHVTHPMFTGPFISSALSLRIPYLITLMDYFVLCYRLHLLNRRSELCPGPRGGENCLKTCRYSWVKKDYVQKRITTAQHVLSHARFIVTPSKFLASMVQMEYPGIPITVIPFGSVHEPAGSQEKLYTKRSKVRFGFMGSLVWHKGVHLLVRVFRKIKNDRCQLRIYGHTYRDVRYRERLTELSGEDPRIVFCGGYSSKQEIAKILGEIDVLCFPSLWFETFGIVVEEALSARVPVIAARIGAIPERIHNGINGLTFQPGDDKDLWAVMKRVADDPTILNQLKRNITSYMSTKKEALQYEKLYRKMLKKSRCDSKIDAVSAS